MLQRNRVLYSITFFCLLRFYFCKDPWIKTFLSYHWYPEYCRRILARFHALWFFIFSSVWYYFTYPENSRNYKGDNLLHYRKWSFIIIAAASSMLIIGGFINAIIPVTREYNITINKSPDQSKLADCSSLGHSSREYNKKKKPEKDVRYDKDLNPILSCCLVI